MQRVNLLKRFKNETEGNVTVMFAVSFTATFFLIGAAFDIMLMRKSQAKVQYLTDAAALAALRYDGDINEKEAAFTDVMASLAKASGQPGEASTSYIKIEETETSLSLHATVKLPHELIMLQNVEGFESISVSTQAVMGIENIEIALVLDISSSMNGSRIVEAKQSATLFVDELLKDQSLNGRVSISLVPFGGTVRVPEEMVGLLDYKENGSEHLEASLGPSLEESTIDFPEKWIDAKWNQCFEFDASDIVDGIKHNGSYRPLADFYSWNYNAPWCPLAGSEMVPLTDDAELLETKINGLLLSDGTGSDHGMAWAYATLNDEWKNKFPGGLKDTPAKNQASTRKVIVFMTDGGITSQHYVRDQDFVNEPPFNSKRKVRVSGNDTRNALYSVCDTAKEQEIEIYTIGYQLKNNTQRAQLEYCASSSNHYLSSHAGDLDDVFRGIVASISPLRISN